MHCALASSTKGFQRRRRPSWQRSSPLPIPPWTFRTYPLSSPTIRRSSIGWRRKSQRPHGQSLPPRQRMQICRSWRPSSPSRPAPLVDPVAYLTREKTTKSESEFAKTDETTSYNKPEASVMFHQPSPTSPGDEFPMITGPTPVTPVGLNPEILLQRDSFEYLMRPRCLASR